MGSEILVIFAPLPFIFWCWHLVQIARKRYRTKHAVYLLAGVSLVAYFCLPFTTQQYFMQGLMFAGAAYIPFFLILWALVMAIALIAGGKHNEATRT